MSICKCNLCKNQKENYKNFHLNENSFKILDKKRPFGLTGHLRVWEEELTVEECIESCIDALDELIITYNPSKDKTENILKKMEKKYPNKIRLFLYKPYIVSSSHISKLKKEKEHEKNEYRNTFSIHNPANYYNFGLIKTTYKYYVKIDADQIYFIEKLFWIKNILKNKENKIINNVENINAFSLGGVNLFYSKSNKNFYVCEIVANGCVGDTLIFEPNSNTYYCQNNTQTYESLKGNFQIKPLGFCWVHLKTLKIKDYDEPTYKKMLLNNFAKKRKVKILNKKISNDNQFIINSFFKEYWNKDRKFIKNKVIWNYLNSILKKID